MSEWKPIKTAPRNGEDVLLVFCGASIEEDPRRKPVVIGQWEMDSWDVPYHDAWFSDHDFTHWMPLPTPPTQEEKS